MKRISEITEVQIEIYPEETRIKQKKSLTLD